MLQIQSKTALVLFSMLVVAGCSGGSGGGGNAPVAVEDTSEWLISKDFVFDGGPGVDGIPALQSPNFESVSTVLTVNPDDLAIAVKHNGEIRIYPHDIMDWHEIVNDGPEDDPFTLSYCPLTGSAVAWLGTASDANTTFGVSGLLYNSNLLLYDRETRSLWSQMYEASVTGPRIRELAERIQLIEAKFGTLRDMYPDAIVMSRNTGYIRDYRTYPYGNYRESSGLLFPVSLNDNRLHPKTRVIGVRSSTGVNVEVRSKVYQLDQFGSTTQTINDQFENQSIVVVGNTDLDFAVIYDRQLADGTILTFMPIENGLPAIMQDGEGNAWDAFGTAVSGPRAGTQLAMTNSFTAFWFAWVAHFSAPEIHFN